MSQGISKACDAAKFKALTYRESDGVVQPRYMYDELQYAEYHGSEGGHFGTWHLDAHEGGEDDEDQRELAVVLMLSDSKAYTVSSQAPPASPLLVLIGIF